LASPNSKWQQFHFELFLGKRGLESQRKIYEVGLEPRPNNDNPPGKYLRLRKTNSKRKYSSVKAFERWKRGISV
jgi:hypothetical protein